MSVSVRRAELADVGAVGPLFERYCVFYERHPSPDDAMAFIRDRMRLRDSVILVAELPEVRGGQRAVGVVQLYPKWSSTTMRRDWIVKDVFGEAGAGRAGVARALMEEAVAFCRRSGAANVKLKTQAENAPARALYEKLGWVMDEAFVTYNCRLNGDG